MRRLGYGLAALLAAAGLAVTIPPARAQSVGYVTGLPGWDPSGGDGIGWGPAYRPETTFAQPGTPPTPGQIAGEAYRARTGRGVYDDVQAPLATGALGPGSYEMAPTRRTPRRAHAPRKPRTASFRAARPR